METNSAELLRALKSVISLPFLFNDVRFVLLDALPAIHDGNWQHNEHRHPWFEFNCVLSGAVYTSIEGAEFLIRAGQCYLVPPGASHSHRHAGHQGDEGFCLRWQLSERPPDPENERVPGIAQSLIRTLSLPRAYPIDGRIDMLPQEQREDQDQAALQAALLRWLLAVFERLPNRFSPEKVKAEDEAQHQLVRQALLYLEAYFFRTIDVQELAASLHVSYRHLSRIFKHETGCTIVEKLNELRIRRARELLADSHLTLKEIAKEVGLQNEYYLSHLFRRIVLCTPSVYRKQLAKGE